jgi:hypothetical protein
MPFSRVGVSGFGSRQSSSSSSLLLLLLAVVAVMAAAVSSMVADVLVADVLVADVVVAGVVVGVVVGAAGVEIDLKTDGLNPVRSSGRGISLWLKRTEIRFYFRLP